jgi:hypothetical protein
MRFSESCLHREIELGHAAGKIQLDAGGLRLAGVLFANRGGNAGAVGAP